MKLRSVLVFAGWLAATALALAGEVRVLKRSDVVFMYQSDRQTYADYGATVLAWGGKPTPQSRAAAEGIKLFGSVGMVTEFARYYERFPETYEQGLCRDINGQPVKVPWLTDHQHKGVPFWWCCTAQPQFRQYLSERVIDTVQAELRELAAKTAGRTVPFGANAGLLWRRHLSDYQSREANATTCRWVTPDAERIELRIDGNGVQVPTVGLWGLLVLGDL